MFKYFFELFGLAPLLTIIFLVLLYIFLAQYEKRKNNIDESKGNLVDNFSNNNYDQFDIGMAETILNHVKVLADTINNTLDKKEFEQALADIKFKLLLLAEYEKYNIFVGCTPSEDLRAINENEYLTRKNFRTRVYKAKISLLIPNKSKEKHKKTKKEEIHTRIENPKRNMSAYDLERFAVMCNAGMEREDEMKQYKKCEEKQD